MRSAIPRVTPGPAVRSALPAARHPLRRGAAGRRQRQRRGGARGVLPEHHADRRKAASPAPRCGTLFRPESAFYSLAAGLTQPIFDGFRLEGQLELAQGRQIELLQLYRKAVVSGFTDVEQALIAVQDSAERERLQQQVVDASRRAFEIAETRLREGTVDLVTVLITQQALFKAEDNRVTGTAGAFAGRVEPVPGARRRLAAAKPDVPASPTPQ